MAYLSNVQSDETGPWAHTLRGAAANPSWDAEITVKRVASVRPQRAQSSREPSSLLCEPLESSATPSRAPAHWSRSPLARSALESALATKPRRRQSPRKVKPPWQHPLQSMAVQTEEAPADASMLPDSPSVRRAASQDASSARSPPAPAGDADGALDTPPAFSPPRSSHVHRHEHQPSLHAVLETRCEAPSAPAINLSKLLATRCRVDRLSALEAQADRHADKHPIAEPDMSDDPRTQGSAAGLSTFTSRRSSFVDDAWPPRSQHHTATHSPSDPHLRVAAAPDELRHKRATSGASLRLARELEDAMFAPIGPPRQELVPRGPANDVMIQSGAAMRSSDAACQHEQQRIDHPEVRDGAWSASHTDEDAGSPRVTSAIAASPPRPRNHDTHVDDGFDFPTPRRHAASPRSARPEARSPSNRPGDTHLPPACCCSSPTVLALERAAQSVGLPVQLSPATQRAQREAAPSVPRPATASPTRGAVETSPHRPFRPERSGSTSRRAEDDGKLRLVLSRIHDVRRQIKSDVGGPPGPAPHLREKHASQATDEAAGAQGRHSGLGDHVRAFYALRDQFFASRDLHRVQRKQHAGDGDTPATL